jgi:hypothetical protein
MSCFHLSTGALGSKNGSWVLDLVGLMEGASLDWSGFAKGFWENRQLSSCGKRVTTMTLTIIFFNLDLLGVRNPIYFNFSITLSIFDMAGIQICNL